MATQIRAKTELRNISGGPRGGIAARETRPSAEQHRKGGNTVYHKKLTPLCKPRLILLQNYHIIVTKLIERSQIMQYELDRWIPALL